MSDPQTVTRSTVAYNRMTGRFRSWYQHGRMADGAFVPVGEPVDDTHTSTQRELWEIAQGLGMFFPCPPDDPPPTPP